MSGSIFQSVPGPKKRYNNFPLGREVLLSGQIGKLIPVQCDEVVPGDIFKQNAAFLCRFSPLSAPAMARFSVHFHTFYVPFRIITPESGRESTYERFIKSIGKHESEVPRMPVLDFDVQNSNDIIKYFGIGTLWDYLGYPVAIPGSHSVLIPESENVTAMPLLAYQRIYQDFYRRDQLEREVLYPLDVSVVDQSVSMSFSDTFGTLDPNKDENQDYATFADLFTLQTKNYERDYFTSALPQPQFGDEVAIGDGNIDWIVDNSNPVQLNVDNSFDASILSPVSGFGENNYVNTTWNEYLGGGPLYGYGKLGAGTEPVGGTGSNLKLLMEGPIYFSNDQGRNLANHLQGNSITINEFRLAMQLQGIKEQINRSGTRYLEIMQGIYGVRVPDARLQRPVYLGGFKSPVSIGSVMQTSQTTETSKQGTLTGQMSATSTGRLCNGGYMFLEHGYLMTIMSITPRTSYFGGMPRKYTKRYPEEYYLQQFDHLGEQAIKKKELYYDLTQMKNGSSEEDFGYSPHYSEYKSSYSTVHGEFRTTLENWHVSRDFISAPSLNPSFIKADPEDFDRIFQFQNVANTSNEHFQMQVYIDVVAKRNMSKYSTPYTLY